MQLTENECFCNRKLDKYQWQSEIEGDCEVRYDDVGIIGICLDESGNESTVDRNNVMLDSLFTGRETFNMIPGSFWSPEVKSRVYMCMIRTYLLPVKRCIDYCKMLITLYTVIICCLILIQVASLEKIMDLSIYATECIWSKYS